MHSVASSGFRFVLFVPYNRLYGLGCLDIRFEYSILFVQYAVFKVRID